MKFAGLKYKFFIVFAFLFYSVTTSGEHIENKTQSDTVIIKLRDYGLEKMRKKDCTKIINKALKEIDNSIPTIIRFPRGEYHFYANDGIKRPYVLSKSERSDSHNCAIVIENQHNLIIDGNGSRLIFHNQIQPFYIDNSTNISIRNTTIDWEQPLTAQAKVTKVNDEFIELAIDLKAYPYRLVDGKLFFMVDKNSNELWKSTTEFDYKERHIAPQTGDAECLGLDWENYIAEDIIPGVIRLYHSFIRKPEIGNILVLQYTEQNFPGIFIQESKNISIKNVIILHSPGVGIYGKNSENLYFNACKVIPNKANGRYFSCGKGGINISNCTGEININNCVLENTLDNAISICTDKNQVVSNVTITNSHIRSNRGSGIILSSNISATIQNNIFESSGSAILFTGNELNSTEKSAFILIDNNEFTEFCFSGEYKLNEGIISIYPDIQPFNENSPQIYRNIKITDNRFNPFDYSVVYARLVDGFIFEDNTITNNSNFEPFHNRPFMFTFEGCKNILINNNSISAEVLGKNIQLKWMNESELRNTQPELEIR